MKKYLKDWKKYEVLEPRKSWEPEFLGVLLINQLQGKDQHLIHVKSRGADSNYLQGVYRPESPFAGRVRNLKSENEIRAAYKMRVEGKRTILQDGDFRYFLFHSNCPGINNLPSQAGADSLTS